MSLYTTTNTDVAPGVGMLSGEAVALAGTVAVASGALAVTAAAGVVFGTGWLLYQAGNLAYSEMERIRLETEERERREQILKEKRIEAAFAERRRILRADCALKETWESFCSLTGDAFQQKRVMESWLEKIREIDEQEMSGNPDSMEQRNARLWELHARTSNQMERLVKEFYKETARAEEKKEAEQLLKTFYELMQKAVLESNVCGHDAQGRTVEEERICLIRQKAKILAVSIQYALEREKDRQQKMPVDEGSKRYLNQLFEGVEAKIHTLIEKDLSFREMALLLEDLERRWEQYRIKAAELNDEEEYFTCTYEAYTGVCKGLMEEVKPKSAFASVKELDETMAYMEKRVAHMYECAKIYAELGRDAYICHAFDVEMKKLGYQMMERKTAGEFVFADCAKQMEQDEDSIFFKMEDGSLSQIYKISEETFVQVIVREDGTTSMETFTADDYAEEQKVIADQKKHCAKSEKLSKALKENWFVITKMDELIPPEIITVRKVTGYDDNEEEMAWETSGAGKQQYQTFDE